MHDQDLIAKVRRREKDALDELFSRHMHKTFAIALNLCSGDREQARDLTQESMLKAVRSIAKFKGEASFSTWLYRIIYNTWIDSRRQHNRWTDIFSPWRWARQKGDADRDMPEEPPDTETRNSPMNTLQEDQLDTRLRDALKELPEKQRIVFRLKVLNEMSIKEIAHMLNSAEGTIKSHFFRATQHLRETLRDWA